MVKPEDIADSAMMLAEAVNDEIFRIAHDEVHVLGHTERKAAIARAIREAAAQLAAVTAENARLREALEFYAEPTNYKGAFVAGGYTDHGTFAMEHHVNLVRKDAGAIARAAINPKAPS